MATILKTSNKHGVAYKVIIKAKGAYLKSKTFTKKTDATAWAKRIEGDQDIIESLGLPGKAIQFNDFADEYMAQWPGKSPNQAARVAYWVECFGNSCLTDIIPDMIRKQLKKFESSNLVIKDLHGKPKVLQKKPQPATVNRYRTVLSSMFRYAIMEGYVTTNPCARVATRRQDNMRNRFLSDRERNRLLDACKQSQ